MMMEIQGKVKPDGIVGKPVIEKSTVRPWARFFARTVDILTSILIIKLILLYIDPCGLIEANSPVHLEYDFADGYHVGR